MTETLEEFANNNSGSLEGFLGAICYDNRATAQRALGRVTQITRAQFDGHLPDSFKGKIVEYPDGRFGIAARYVDGHGELCEVC